VWGHPLLPETAGVGVASLGFRGYGWDLTICQLMPMVTGSYMEAHVSPGTFFFPLAVKYHVLWLEPLPAPSLAT
jgi:hypothetical protein